MILMPLLVYPVLSLVFRTFLATNSGLFADDGKPIILRIVYATDRDEEFANRFVTRFLDVVERAEFEAAAEAKSSGEPQSDREAKSSGDNPPAVGSKSGKSFGALSRNPDSQFVGLREHRWAFLLPGNPKTIRQIVEDGEADLAVVISKDEAKPLQFGKLSLISRDDPFSVAAADYLRDKVEIFNEEMTQALLRSARLPTDPAMELIDQPITTGESATSAQAFSLASLIPLILVLMTITGAVYPAIDLTAGEKERGTLETLMAAPIPRVGILLSKFSAVMTVAVLTAILNIVGMAATVWAFRLDQFLPGSSEFTLVVVLKILLLLILFAAFYSAVLLVVTSYARSFKEAQAYLVPIILFSMGPGLIAMTPGLKLSGAWAVMPMINILLLARDVIQNEVVVIPACIAIFSTAFYASAAIVLAARIFGSDSILYSTHGSFGEMFGRPSIERPYVPIAAAVFCVALLFPINFLSIGFLGRLPAETPVDLTIRFMVMGLFTILSFLVFPYLIGLHQRANVRSAFGLHRPKLIFLLAALLLGISLWPLVMSLISGWHEVYGWVAGADKGDAWHDRLVKETAQQVARIRQVSPVVIAISLSILPAICEEWFFRGMLLHSLLRIRKAWSAILISAIVFGLFHVLSNSVIALDRLVPTTLVGLVLGYIAYQSGSIWPGVLLHSIHNAAVAFLAYYQPRLSQFSWFPGEDDPLPWSWILAGAVLATIGLTLLVIARKEVGSDTLKVDIEELAVEIEN